MRQLAQSHAQSKQNSVSLDDDGELQDLVFCLHCHALNPAGAKRCKSCAHALNEAPSDLRDRLERIRDHNSDRGTEDANKPLLILPFLIFILVEKPVNAIATVLVTSFNHPGHYFGNAL